MRAINGVGSFRNNLISLCVVLLAVGTALIASFAIDLFSYPVTSAFFFAAIMISTWYCGRAAGITAIVMSTLLVTYFLMPPFSTFQIELGGGVRLAVFVGVSFLINWITSGYQERERIIRRDRDRLRESEERLLKVFGDSPVAVVVTQLSDRTFTDVNAEFTRLTGWGRDEVLGDSVDRVQLVSDEDREALSSELDKTNAIFDRETRIRTRGGELRHVIMGTVVAEMSGEPHAITTFIDITERKEAEDDRHASDSRYQTLFNYSPDGILIADQQSYYLDANDTMCRILGYTRDELIGMHASDIVVLDEMAHIETALETIKSGSEYSREWQFTPDNLARKIRKVLDS